MHRWRLILKKHRNFNFHKQGCMLGIPYGVAEFIETIIEFSKIKNPYKI